MDKKVEELERKMKRTIEEKVHYVDLLKQVLNDESGRKMRMYASDVAHFLSFSFVVMACMMKVFHFNNVLSKPRPLKTTPMRPSICCSIPLWLRKTQNSPPPTQLQQIQRPRNLPLSRMNFPSPP